MTTRAVPVTLLSRLSLALLLCVTACEQSVDEGQLDSAPPVKHDAAGTDEGPLPDGAPDGSFPDSGPPGKTVKVTYKGQTTVVDLSKPPPVDFEGSQHAKLDAVITLALPGQSHGGLTADFTSGDGYMPGMKSNCKGLVPVAGAVFSMGYIDVSTRKLRWDLSLKQPGCMYLKDLAEITVADK